MGSRPTDAAFLARNTVDCLPRGGLESRLASGKPLRVKLGLDPTAPDIHFGHVVVLQKLREFQDAGHLVVLIVGDYTARVGDPSGRSSTRPQLSGAQIDENAATYQAQAFRILDPDRVEVRRNSEWLDMPMEKLFALARTTTVAQILERDDFSKRYAGGEPISLLELMYPLMQAYDSVAIKADVELGGTDQKFNLLLGRDLQRAYGQPEQVVMTMPILPGLDGERKMSKSLGNHVGVTQAPADMYGKTLSLPDEAMPTWFDLLLGEPVSPGLSPRDAKHALAAALVERFYDRDAATDAAADFTRHVIDRQVRTDVAECSVAANADGTVHLPAALEAAFAISRSEGRRLLAQGAVKIDGIALGSGALDVDAPTVHGAVLQAGKRKYARITVVESVPSGTAL